MAVRTSFKSVGKRNWTIKLSPSMVYRDNRATFSLDADRGIEVWHANFELEKIQAILGEIVSMLVSNAEAFIRADLRAAAAAAPPGMKDDWLRAASAPGQKKMQYNGEGVYATYTKGGEAVSQMTSGVQLGDKKIEGTDTHRKVLYEIAASLGPGGEKRQVVRDIIESHGYPVGELNIEIEQMSLTVVNKMGRKSRVRRESFQPLSRENMHMLDTGALGLYKYG